MDDKKLISLNELNGAYAQEDWDESDIPIFVGEMLREIIYRPIREFIEAEEERLIALFLEAIGRTWDDPIIESIPQKELLEDAQTIQKILKKYRAKTYAPSYPKRPKSKYERFAALIVAGEMTKDED